MRSPSDRQRAYKKNTGTRSVFCAVCARFSGNDLTETRDFIICSWCKEDLDKDTSFPKGYSLNLKIRIEREKRQGLNDFKKN